ncbi:MAG: CRISPR-associated helicase Cas3', partial [Desulfobulbaceae bacterium]|nr:CRISPR-associated helicase Cas3' [Desulfobulbaceae bacterium]
NAFLQRIAPDFPVSHLIHGNSWLMTTSVGIEPAKTDQETEAADDARTARDWFASPKRALLAPFGVGTVDQALLGVVAAKHFFVRHFALAGKVVIIDEVHSYDLYTGTLIDKLISTLEGLGCTVIVLSATLSGRRRGQIVSQSCDPEDDTAQPYPLITGRMEGTEFAPVSAAPPTSRTIQVAFVTVGAATEEAVQLARHGGTVLWICNTVDAAQQQYRKFMGLAQDSIQVGLLHSRFPFWRREELEAEWMERLGKDSKNRRGSILVATQVVEQSVDLDADLMITELAPTDMLLQRLGRLWRHERGERPLNTPRFLIIEEDRDLDTLRILKAKEIVECLGRKAKVYAPFILLRSLEVWREQSEVSIPGHIRRLIESTYEERDCEPVSWQQLADEWFGTDSAKKMLAMRNTNLWQVALEDEEGAQTRLNEVPTVALVLCRAFTTQKAVFADQSKALLEGGGYRFATAQAIHKNLVKIPKYCFDHVTNCRAFVDYLHGEQCVGIVEEDGMVAVQGLKKGIRVSYSDEFGLVVEKPTKRRGYEYCL